MREVKSVIGKKLLAVQETKMYFGFPSSDEVKTLSKNAVSGNITSYLPTGYFEIEGSQRGNWYVKDNDKIKVVNPETTGTASVFDKAGNYIADLWNFNTTKAIKKTGYLSDGLKESISDVSLVGSKLGKELRFIIIGAGAILVIFLIRDLIKTLK